jgi:hypothetical protein
MVLLSLFKCAKSVIELVDNVEVIARHNAIKDFFCGSIV